MSKQPGLFEADYTINGTHATKLKFLAKKNSRDDEPDNPKSAKIFERYIDVYMNAAVWGIYYCRRAKNDTTSADRARIYADAFIRERENCKFLYRLVILLDDSKKLTQDERVDRAFRFDADSDKADEVKKNFELFNDYVRGGIDIMYEKFTDGCHTRDDYLERIFKVMTDFQAELDGIDYDAELARLSG
ncbi:MAG: hypothetical protein IJ774_14840 [Selenomonadaceae bacterium]|nr:hypothetical protein [Selenomonadaceae bacterium]